MIRKMATSQQHRETHDRASMEILSLREISYTDCAAENLGSKGSQRHRSSGSSNDSPQWANWIHGPWERSLAGSCFKKTAIRPYLTKNSAFHIFMPGKSTSAAVIAHKGLKPDALYVVSCKLIPLRLSPSNVRPRHEVTHSCRLHSIVDKAITIQLRNTSVC